MEHRHSQPQRRYSKVVLILKEKHWKNIFHICFTVALSLSTRKYFYMFKFKRKLKINRIQVLCSQQLFYHWKKKNPHWLFSSFFYCCFCLSFFHSLCLSLFSLFSLLLSPLCSILFSFLTWRKEKRNLRNKLLVHYSREIHDLEVPVGNSFEYLQQPIDNK